MIDEQIVKLRAKRDSLRDQHKNKMKLFFEGLTKNSRGPKIQMDLYVTAASLFGLEEQLYSLENNVLQQDRVKFINNLSELGLDNELLEQLLKQPNDPEPLAATFKIESLSGAALNLFRLHTQKFVNVLVQFVAKRNAYRKKTCDNLLIELTLLKSLLIKHYCIVQKVAGFQTI